MTRPIKRTLDEYFMRMALSLALRGTGNVEKNPRVGCVIVQGDELVGVGFHAQYGGYHAEVEAVRVAGNLAQGSTVYVNLEPCCHIGKTPPCTDLLIKHKVKRVVIATEDPNPLVAGKGVDILKNAGIEVECGILEEDARWINRGFFSVVKRERPWVTIKAALSIDGNIALLNGESKWISNPFSRQKAHLLRAENDAILVGIGTILRDDPALTVRDSTGRSPIRVILDHNANTPLHAKIFKQSGKNLIFVKSAADVHRVEELRKRGATVLFPEGNEDCWTVSSILKQLVCYGVAYVLVEGGASVISSFLNERVFDACSLFVSPKLLGNGLQMCHKHFLSRIQDAYHFKNVAVEKLGDDVWYEGVFDCSLD